MKGKVLILYSRRCKVGVWMYGNLDSEGINETPEKSEEENLLLGERALEIPGVITQNMVTLG